MTASSVPPRRCLPAHIALVVGAILLSALTVLPPVAARPAVGDPLSVRLTGPTHLALGLAAQFVANATGGAPPYAFHWTVNGTAMDANTSANGSVGSFTFRPVADAIYFVGVNVTDSGRNASAVDQYLSVVGASPVTVRLVVAATYDSGAVTLAAIAAGGTGPYSYRWVAPGVPTAWTASANVTTEPLASGTYPVSVEARDQFGYLASTAVTLQNHVENGDTGLPWYTWLGIGIGAGLVGMLAAIYVRRRRVAQT